MIGSSDIGHRTSDIGHRTSDIEIRRSLFDGWCCQSMYEVRLRKPRP